MTYDELPQSPDGVFLFCPMCHAEYSAAHGDYCHYHRDIEVSCGSCASFLHLARKVVRVERVMPKNEGPRIEILGDEDWRESISDVVTDACQELVAQVDEEGKVSGHAEGHFRDRIMALVETLAEYLEAQTYESREDVANQLRERVEAAIEKWIYRPSEKEESAS